MTGVMISEVNKKKHRFKIHVPHYFPDKQQARPSERRSTSLASTPSSYLSLTSWGMVMFRAEL